MEEQKHNIVSSESIYMFKLLEMILHICESLIGDKVFVCFSQRNFKSNDDIKSNNPSFEYNFFWPLEVTRKMLQELPAAIDFASTLPKKCSVTNGEVDRMLFHNFPDAIDTLKSRQNGGWYKQITKRLLTSNGNKEYYIGISQSAVYGSHHICLIRRKLNVEPVMDNIFELTLPNARALLSRFPAALLFADSHRELCWAKEPRTIPLECTTTDMVCCVSKYKIYKKYLIM